MSSKSFNVSVEPAVLIWARESIGISTDDEIVKKIVKKIKGITINTIKEWEKKDGAVRPTFAQIEQLSTVYKRPLSAFLLPAPPKDPPFPKDFRTIPSKEKQPLKPKTYLAIRKARRFQYSAIELIKELGEESRKLSIKANLSDNPETLAEKVRIQFGIKEFSRSTSFTRETALDEWIKVLENNGILVFQISITKNKEIRGFSLIDDAVPAIALRRSDETSAKIFTLFHELAHLLLREGGICDLEESDISSHEKFCNHFAGAFLVPRDKLLNHSIVKTNAKVREWPENFLRDIARDFYVSREVILRRLLMLGLTTKEYYLKKHKEWKSKYKEPFVRGKKNEIKICLQERGKKYTSMAFDAYERRKIDAIGLADYLGVTSDKISKIKEAI